MAHSRLAVIWKAGCKTKHSEHKNLLASATQSATILIQTVIAN